MIDNNLTFNDTIRERGIINEDSQILKNDILNFSPVDNGVLEINCIKCYIKLKTTFSFSIIKEITTPGPILQFDGICIAILIVFFT